MKIKTNILFFTIFLLKGVTYAQTVNIGELTILPGTLLSSKFNFDNAFSGSLLNDGELVIYSDFNNDGLILFADNQNSSVKFVGKKKQRISGSSPAEYTKFNNIIFDNNSKQPAFEVSGNISISGSTDFSKGIVKIDNSDASIVYEKDASHFNTDNESYIDGYIEKIGNTDFSYPTGDDLHYRYAKVLPTNANVNTSLRGKYFFKNSNLNFIHSSKVGNLERIDDKEYWEIENNSGDPEIMVTLSWDQSTTPDFIWKDLKKSETNEEIITIVRWDKDQKLWVDESGVVEIGINGTGSGTVTSFSKVSGFGVFTLAKIKKSTKNDGYVFIYNAVSPNNDGKNDFFKIDGIQKYPNNQVSIYNRWGAKVFETRDYDSKGNVFDGYAQFQGKKAVNNDNTLPTGTYFYVLNYEIIDEGFSRNVEKVGYLYLSDN